MGCDALLPAGAAACALRQTPYRPTARNVSWALGGRRLYSEYGFNMRPRERSHAAGLLDAQIVAHQCEPCIVVMPDSEFRHKRYGLKGFEHDLFTDIIPLIKRTYRVRTDADSRAIAGLSMGGFYSIEIGLNHLDRFRWIGVFSAGLRSGFVTADDITGLGVNSKQAVSRLKLFYVRIGTKDFFLPDARRLDRWLAQKSVPHLYQEVEGTHELPVWERALADFTPRLFKPRSL